MPWRQLAGLNSDGSFTTGAITSGAITSGAIAATGNISSTAILSGNSFSTTLDGTIGRDLTITRYGVGAGMDSWQVACSSAASPNSTTNVTISGLSQTVTSPGTSAVYNVTIEADIQITVANTINVIELLVDGTAQTVQLVTFCSTANTWRGTGSRTWRITGLSAGSHTFTSRTRNTAGSTGASIAATHTLMTVDRKA